MLHEPRSYLRGSTGARASVQTPEPQDRGNRLARAPTGASALAERAASHPPPAPPSRSFMARAWLKLSEPPQRHRRRLARPQRLEHRLRGHVVGAEAFACESRPGSRRWPSSATAPATRRIPEPIPRRVRQRRRAHRRCTRRSADQPSYARAPRRRAPRPRGAAIAPSRARGSPGRARRAARACLMALRPVRNARCRRVCCDRGTFDPPRARATHTTIAALTIATTAVATRQHRRQQDPRSPAKLMRSRACWKARAR